MPHAPSRLPNLYQLLGLDPLESDRQRIVSSLKKVETRLKRLRDPGQDSKPDEQKRVQKLLTLGQHWLLDPARKQAYDLQWQAAYGTPETTASMSNSSAAASSASAPAQWNLASLEAWLPAGDPHAPFDLASYLRSSELRDPAAAQADLNQLLALLAGKQLSTTTPAPPSSSPPAVATERSLATGSESPKIAVSLAQRRRQRQQRTRMLISLGAIAGALALAGLLVFLNRPKTSPRPVAQTPVKQPAQAPPTDDAQNTSSNLAQPSAMQPSVMQPSAMSGDSPASPAFAQQLAPADTSASGLIQPGQLARPLEIQATGEESPDEPLSDHDKRVWQSNLKSVSVSLGKLRVTEAHKRLTELQSEIKTPRQRQQHARLTTVAALVADARQCIVDAILNLEAGQVLTIKNTKVSFIDGDENHIVVRHNGERREFKLEDLTAAMAEALINQHQLDARLLAAQGAYLMLHPKNSVVLDRAKQMLQDAADDGVISPELAKFYEDDYSLEDQ